jgi:hypothetical protein
MPVGKTTGEVGLLGQRDRAEGLERLQSVGLGCLSRKWDFVQWAVGRGTGGHDGWIFDLQRALWILHRDGIGKDKTQDKKTVSTDVP